MAPLKEIQNKKKAASKTPGGTVAANTSKANPSKRRIIDDTSDEEEGGLPLALPDPFIETRPAPAPAPPGSARARRHHGPEAVTRISKPDFRRIARRGGVKRISAKIYDPFRKALTSYMQRMVQPVIAYTEHLDRNTITKFDVIYGLKSQGTHFYDTQEFTPPRITPTPRRLRNPQRIPRSKKPVGLRNVESAWRYMNSALQCLLRIPEVAVFLLSNYDKFTVGVSRAFARLALSVYSSRARVVSPRALVTELCRVNETFADTKQEEFHKFPFFLLKCLTEDAGTNAEIDLTKLDLLAGQFLSTTNCTTCNHFSTVPERFATLTLPMSGLASSEGAQSSMILEESLDSFFDTPWLIDWNCSECSGNRATLKTRLSYSPQILAIAIGWFSTSENVEAPSRIDGEVLFPSEKLDLTKYLARADGEPIIYDLAAVSCHTGDLENGHYSAFAPNPMTKQWYYFNDTVVEPWNPEKHVKVYGQASMLYYSRRNSCNGPDFEEALRYALKSADGKKRRQVQEASTPPEEPATSQNTTDLAERLHAGPREYPKAPLGISNPGGNKCFMTSTLQCLINIPEFTQFFIQRQDPWDSRLASMLGWVAELLLAQNGSSLSLDPILQEIRTWRPEYANAEKHDAHEFAFSLLQGLREQLAKEKGYAGGTEIFNGALNYTTNCLNCGHASIELDTFSSLPLPISDPNGENAPPAFSTLPLDKCLGWFLDPVAAPAWKCDKCQQHGGSTHTKIVECPDVLWFMVERCEGVGEGENQELIKIDHRVHFPTEGLDLTKYVRGSEGESYIYDLVSVSCHTGNPSDGHYTAYVKSLVTGQWHHCDDEVVKPAELKGDALYGEVDQLFYRRRGVNPGPEAEEVVEAVCQKHTPHIDDSV